MELKESIEVLDSLSSLLYYPRDKEAFQVIFSYLETLQKVQEMGGVKRLTFGEVYDKDSNCDSNYVCGYNYALDLKNAELARRLESASETIDRVYLELKQKL